MLSLLGIVIDMGSSSLFSLSAGNTFCSMKICRTV